MLIIQYRQPSVEKGVERGVSPCNILDGERNWPRKTGEEDEKIA